MGAPHLPFEQRFWTKVDLRGPEECWGWLAATRNGYGHIGLKRQNIYAHRASYEMAHGPIPSGQVIDHICRNRLCVNPSHLRVVTHQQNFENHGGPRRDSKSRVRGVSWSKTNKKWYAQMRRNGQHVLARYFDSIEDAEAAVIAKRNELYTNNLVDRSDRAA